MIERLDLEGGQYYADIGIYEADWTYAYDYHWHVYPILIRPRQAIRASSIPPIAGKLTMPPYRGRAGRRAGNRKHVTSGDVLHEC